MKTLNDYIDQQLENPEFARAWLEGEDEYRARRALEHAQADGESQITKSTRTGGPGHSRPGPPDVTKGLSLRNI